jgi:hypothetical protein
MPQSSSTLPPPPSSSSSYFAPSSQATHDAIQPPTNVVQDKLHWISRPEYHDTHAMVAHVHDIFPHLGDGFVHLCIQACHGELEHVISCLLEDTLPEGTEDTHTYRSIYRYIYLYIFMLAGCVSMKRDDSSGCACGPKLDNR